jgi:arylformamidase
MEAGGRSDIIPLAAFVGRAWLSDVCTMHGELSLADLQLPPEGPIERLLLRSDHTVALGRFPDAWPWLSATCVEQLIDRGLRLLAVDCPSVDDRHSKTLAVHHAVFGAGAFVLENLDLRQLAPAWYDLVAAPLRIEGMDAAPARAFIILHG